jgi:hypothetical protein
MAFLFRLTMMGFGIPRMLELLAPKSRFRLLRVFPVFAPGIPWLPVVAVAASQWVFATLDRVPAGPTVDLTQSTTVYELQPWLT